MAIRKSKKNKDIMLGFIHKLEDGLFTIELGKMDYEKGMEAVEAYKAALEDPNMKKSIFIIRKEAKPMSAAARTFMEEIDKCEDGHILAAAMVFSSISIMHLAKMMTKVDDTDVQFFTDLEKAEQWAKAWESKEQSKAWLKSYKKK